MFEENLHLVENLIGEFDIYPLKNFELNKKTNKIEILYSGLSPSNIINFSLNELLESINEYIEEDVSDKFSNINKKEKNKIIENEITKTINFFNKIMKKNCERLIINIKYPLKEQVNFEVLFNKRNITVYELHLINALVYQQIYDVENKTTPRFHDYGYYKIWGHDITDLLYNGILNYCNIDKKTLWFNL
jgi:hypothetical protein